MDCQGCQDLLVDFLYGELDPDARRAFQAHLDECAACAREAEQLGQVLSLVRAHPEEAPADAVSQRILHAARATTDHREHQAAAAGPAPWWRWLLSPAPMTAVLALVVVSVGLAVYLSKPTIDPAPAPGPKELAEVSPVAAPARPAGGAAGLEQAKDAPAKATADETPRREADLEQADRKPEARPATRPADAPPPEAPASAAPTLDAARAAGGSAGLAKSPRTEFEPAKSLKRRRAKKAEKAKARARVLGGALAPQADKKADQTDDLFKGQAGAKRAVGKPEDTLAGAEDAGGALRRPTWPDADDASPAERSATVRPRPKPAATAKSGPAPARFASPPPPAKPKMDAETQQEEREAVAEKKSPAREPSSPAVQRAAPVTAAPAESMAAQAAGDMADTGADGVDEVRGMEEAVRPGSTGRSTARRGRAQGVDLYAQADRALTRKEYAVAAVGFRTFLAERPGDARAPTARYLMARALFLAGRCPQAIEATRLAVRTAPRHRLAADALFDQASCFVRQGQFAEAQRIYQRIEREHPGRASEASREAERIAPVEAAPAAER